MQAKRYPVHRRSLGGGERAESAPQRPSPSDSPDRATEPLDPPPRAYWTVSPPSPAERRSFLAPCMILRYASVRQWPKGALTPLGLQQRIRGAPMLPVALPPREFLHECFEYDPLTGLFRWKRRPEHHFISPREAARWNSRHAGTSAFTSFNRGHHRTSLTYDGDTRCVLASRVAWKMMTGEEYEMIDHKDRNRANDWFSNLRPATSAQNARNRVRRNFTGLPKGVTTVRGRFVAAGHIGTKRYHIGTFDTPEEAHEAYCVWTRPLHKEFFAAS